MKKNMTPRVLCLLCASLLLSLNLFAQRLNVKGVVKDGTGEPIIGANVLIKGSGQGTITDYDGLFEIEATQGAILSFSFVGYQPQEAAATASMRITLKEDSELLDDVVVIGYGSVKKSDATGSVIAIKPDEFNKGNRVSAQEALVGKVAGVNVVANSGAPGQGSTIRIRSGASLSASNDPLIVIDGVPVDNSGIEGSSNVIGAINPNDIETFTVLKDASATAIYGSRASNGVILITTKKGGSDKPRISYSNSFSVSQVVDKIDVLTAEEFRQFVPTVTGVPENVEFGTANTDWQDEIHQTAFGHEHNFSVSGRLKKSMPYRASLGYTDQEGTIKTNRYQRYTLGLGATPKFFNDHLTIDLNAKLSHERDQQIDGGVVGTALDYDPTRPVKTGSSSWQTDPGLGYFIWMNGNSPMAIQGNNPVAMLELQDRVNRVKRSIGNAVVNYKVHGLEALSFNLNLGYDILQSNYTNDVPELAGMMYTGNQKDGTGLAEASRQEKKNKLLDFYGNYSNEWGKHSFSAMAGYGWQHFWKQLNQTTYDTHGNELASAKHYETEYYLLSFYGRLNYAYDNRYLLTATLRSDASSRFKKENRWGIFPSAAFSWRINQEAFLIDSNWVSDLKLRLSYGTTGQQDIINDYPYMTTFTASYPESSYQFGDEWYQTFRPNGYDSDIKWETTATYNIGVDYGFLRNRIYGSIDYYKRFTKDLLNQINVISGTNYAPVIFTNIGEMKNQGLELSFNAVPIHTKDWEWNIGVNYTWTQSKITKLNVVDSASSFVETGYISGTGRFVQVFMIDQTPYTFYLPKQAYDENGQAIEGQFIQPDGSISSTATCYATGKSALPTSLIGLNTNLSYRNWNLAISGHGSLGSYVYNYVRATDYKEKVYSDQGSYSNILRSTSESGFNQQHHSDYFLEKGDFFRLDNITLGYTFPHLWSKSSSLNLNFGIQNLFTISKYSGLDPEIYSGIDMNVYQRPRVYTLGMNLTF